VEWIQKSEFSPQLTHYNSVGSGIIFLRLHCLWLLSVHEKVLGALLLTVTEKNISGGIYHILCFVLNKISLFPVSEFSVLFLTSKSPAAAVWCFCQLQQLLFST